MFFWIVLAVIAIPLIGGIGVLYSLNRLLTQEYRKHGTAWVYIIVLAVSSAVFIAGVAFIVASCQGLSHANGP